jgi:hypothetical protein
MDQEIRNKLRNVVTQCRKLLEDSISQELEGKYGIFAKKDQVTADPNAKMPHLSEEEQAARKDVLDHFAHIKARGFGAKDALDQLIREIAFTHLNRLCAYKMMEAREVFVGGQKFREAVSRGVNSNGVKFYLAEHEDDERLFNTGHQDVAYRHFLNWLGGALSDEIGVLFNPNDPANRLYPRQKTLDEVLDLLNGGGIKAEETELREQWPQIWSQDETIGWVYQYFTPKELRDQARKESSAPRNSYELAFRNQFFTPRYVVEFLTDNTLGRIWYEMHKGETKLKDQCRYMVRRPTEIFLKDGEQPPKDAAKGKDDLSQEERLKLPVHIPHRPKKDPRELKILDPACGSGHFLLYCFDLLLTIYEEAYADPDLGPTLQKDYPKLEDLRRDVPRLILAHNLHGIDIDLRASQIAALALWLRCQRAYQEMGLKKDRPKITRSNFVCAEPMPGEEQLLKEFVSQLEPKLLGQVIEVVFEKMKLAGVAGSLLKIEEEIRDAVAAAKKQFIRETTQATDRRGQPLLFTQAAMDRLAGKPDQPSLFDLSDITDSQFFEQAEAKAIELLRQYAEKAHNGQQLQRRLFSEDAVRGFAFVDLCQKRYDVVLMNPPFGEPTPKLDVLLRSSFPTTCNDIFASFVERGLGLLANTGAVGAITSKTFFYTKRLRDYRALLRNSGTLLSQVADFGLGVLDAAVETCCYSIHRGPFNERHFTHFYDLTSSAIDDFGTSLLSVVKTDSDSRRFVHRLSSFDVFPFGAFAYWAPLSVFKLFRDVAAFEPLHGDVVKGITTFDDFQFTRLSWEVPKDTTRWLSVAKGGGYGLFVSEHSLVIDWHLDGKHLQQFEIERYDTTARTTQSKTFWFKPGLTFSEVSSIGFSVQPWPAGRLFGGPGFVICPKNPSECAMWLALFNSNYANSVLTLLSTDRHWSCLSVGKLPIPLLSEEDKSLLAELGMSTWRSLVGCVEINETTDEFAGPILRGVTPSAFSGIRQLSSVERQQIQGAFANAESSIDRIDSLLGERANVSIQDLGQKVKAFEHRSALTKVEKTPLDTERLIGEAGATKRILSFAIGAIVGRWDVRPFLGLSDMPEITDPFATRGYKSRLLTDNEKLPQSYPIRIDGDGIMPDQPDHTGDIVCRLREIFELIWKNRAESIEKEVSEVLGVKELRDYFRRPGKGGFWDDHISRYSKSRRKAPIYWLLQSSKKNYALWLYYHRLDKDLLFKALVNYVEPKIRLETSRLESLQTQKAAAGESGKEAKRIAKDVERQEDFLSELRDFEDKLRRAANLHLEPDLNDGVVLNIAPLHELVPWKEAKSYWDELLKGEYEWSSIGKQLRQKGLVK